MLDSTVNVYWTPNLHPDSKFNKLFSDPQRVLQSRKNELNETRLDAGNIGFFACPATIDLFKRTYYFKSTIDTEIKINDWVVKSEDAHVVPELLAIKSEFPIRRVRPTTLKDQTNLTFDVSWLFFADQPLTARFTAPYFPPLSPGNGAMLSSGQYDIGQWFRQFNLDYHITKDTESLIFKKDDPLFYVDFLTDKKIKIHKYKMTKRLQEFQKEYLDFTLEHGKKKPLSFRYKAMNENNMNKYLLDEIKKNLVN